MRTTLSLTARPSLSDNRHHDYTQRRFSRAAAHSARYHALARGGIFVFPATDEIDSRARRQPARSHVLRLYSRARRGESHKCNGPAIMVAGGGIKGGMQ